MQGVLFLFLIVLLVFFVFGIRRSMKMSGKSVELIAKYEKNTNDPKLIDEIFDFISAEILLGRIVRKYNADKDDIAELHKKLKEYGDFRKYNRYIPITSFFNVTTLEYLLKHKDDPAKSLTMKMMNHFHI